MKTFVVNFVASVNEEKKENIDQISKKMEKLGCTVSLKMKCPYPMIFGSVSSNIVQTLFEKLNNEGVSEIHVLKPGEIVDLPFD